ncbi:hypothetical protein AeMF1_008950 [Aphanomyces euteiches]|nr:hypothetical protein AeMF1_008950 [Aphanomyces euteiches]
MTLWTDELDTIWINEMIHQANVLGKRSNCGFKKEAWLSALAKLNDHPGCKFNMMQLKSRNTTLKEKFSLVWSMANASGMGFERSRSLVVCISTTWDAFLQGKSEEIKKWQNKPFPLFTLCEVLYAGSLAKGKHVLSSTTPISRTHYCDAGSDEEDTTIQENANDQDESDASNEPTDDAQHGTGLQPEKRRRVSDDYSSPKRLRQSAATVLANELRSQSENIAKELAVFSKAIVAPSSKNMDNTVELAIGILQTDFEFLMEEDDMLKAIDVLAISQKAKLFLKLQGSLREAWLRMQIANSATVA